MKDLMFFLNLAHRDRWWLRLGAALAALTLLAGIGLLSLSGWFITAAAIAGLAGAGGAFNYLFASGGVRGSALFRTLGRYGERLVTHEATFRILAELRLWVFERATPLTPSRLGRMRSGDLLARVTQDVDALDTLYLRLITPVIAALTGVVFTSALLAFTAPAALPGVLGVFIFASLILPAWAARRSTAPGQEIASQSALARAEASDLVAGLAELKAYGADQRFVDRLDRASTGWINAQRQIAGQSWLNTALLSLSAPTSFVLGFALAVSSGAAAPLAALAGLVAFGLFEAATPLIMTAELYGKTTRSARRLKALDELTPDVIEPSAPQSLPERWDIAFKAVHFTYPGSNRPVLHGVDLTLAEGDRLALVGGSGAGKSSLIKLLMRFYAPRSGALTLGGAAMERLGLEDTRSRFAVVDQRAALLSATIGDNLRLAHPEASEKELWTALEHARAAAFVKALPNQLDTWVGEQGGLVSGGQARRIALARAFVKNAPVLLLDEPTEGLDADTEADFLDALTAWLDEDARRSTLIVTHRTALLDHARTVAVLDQGAIAATGPAHGLAGHVPEFDRLFPNQRARPS